MPYTPNVTFMNFKLYKLSTPPGAKHIVNENWPTHKRPSPQPPRLHEQSPKPNVTFINLMTLWTFNSFCPQIYADVRRLKSKITSAAPTICTDANQASSAMKPDSVGTIICALFHVYIQAAGVVCCARHAACRKLQTSPLQTFNFTNFQLLLVRSTS